MKLTRKHKMLFRGAIAMIENVTDRIHPVKLAGAVLLICCGVWIGILICYLFLVIK